MFKKQFYAALFFSSILLLNSCSQKNETITPVTPTPLSAKKPDAAFRICTEMHLPKSTITLPKSNTGLAESAAIFTSKKWATGQTIKIKFLNGDAFLQGKVKQFAGQWLAYANLNFQYVSAGENADVKINFDNSGGSWSYLGIDCQQISQTSPSMNFGWFTSSTSDGEFIRVVTHEFGHVLGLVHEHQSPVENIPWNKPVVYAYYAGYPNYWSTATVDNNIFYKYSTTQTNYSKFDSKSIMEYPVDASLTTNGYSIGWNRTLSDIDINFIGTTYDYPANSRNHLFSNQSLYQGDYLTSNDKRFKLIMQTDGNLVLYKNNNVAIWHTVTFGKPYINRLVMQGDGNAVLYDKNDKYYWNSHTNNYHNGYLVLQNDGNLVIYQNGIARWNSGTGGQQ